MTFKGNDAKRKEYLLKMRINVLKAYEELKQKQLTNSNNKSTKKGI